MLAAGVGRVGYIFLYIYFSHGQPSLKDRTLEMVDR